MIRLALLLILLASPYRGCDMSDPYADFDRAMNIGFWTAMILGALGFIGLLWAIITPTLPGQ